MSAVNQINSILNQINQVMVNQLNQPDNSNEKNGQGPKGDSFTRSQPAEKVTYTRDDLAAENGIKRPIKINNRNNTFFINHNNRNRALKIDPGAYNLTEIQAAIQEKANEEFGIGKLSLKLTGSGKDRLIYAEDKKEEIT